MIKDYVLLSVKNLKRRGLRSYLTLLGIFIGIMVVIALIGLGNGLRDTVNAQFGISSTQVITVQAGGVNSFGPPGSGAVNPLTSEDVKAIERVGVVERVVPRIIQSVKAEFNDKVVFSYVASMPKGENRDFIYENLEIEALYGKLIRDSDTNSVVLGYGFYNGETNGFGRDIEIGRTIKIQDKNFRIAGILEKKGSFIIDNSILMDEDELKDLIDVKDRIDVMAVKIKEKDDMDVAKQNIEQALRKSRGVKVGEENFDVSTPEAQLASINQILLGIQIFIIIIAAVSILVGAIGIVNTMTTSVLERRKEIGVMKAIGAKNSDIFMQFFIEAGLLGLIGGVLGAIFGTAIGYFGTKALNEFVGATTSLNINFPLIFFCLVGSFLIGSISGIAPALKAAREVPVEALRG